MKVIIIGAGISGLSSYLLLKKHLPEPATPAQSHTIVIYDAYETSRDQKRSSDNEVHPGAHGQEANSISVGGGLGVMPNGMNVLKRLSDELFSNVMAAGHPLSAFKLSNARGWTLATLPVQSKDDPPLAGCMISRQALWSCLREQVPDDAIATKRVIDVLVHEGVACNIVRFTDDSPDEEADLVIGADGLRSPCRKAIFAKDDKQQHEAHYEGIVGVGGFIPSSILSSTAVEPGHVGLIFGPTGFFGYGYNTTAPFEQYKHASMPGEQAIWWSTYELASCPDSRNVDREDVKRQLLARHKGYNNQTIRKIIETVRIDVVWPTWTIPVLPTWERSGVVLVGDAAHALQPSSGQGVSQALEDAEALVLFLEHYLREGYHKPKESQVETEVDAATQAAKHYVALRKPRVKKLYDASQRMGAMKKNLNVVREMIMYFAVWVMGKFFMGPIQDGVINYNVPDEVGKMINSLEMEEKK